MRPFFLCTKLRRALATDSKNLHAKTVDPSEQN